MAKPSVVCSVTSPRWLSVTTTRVRSPGSPSRLGRAPSPPPLSPSEGERGGGEGARRRFIQAHRSGLEHIGGGCTTTSSTAQSVRPRPYSQSRKKSHHDWPVYASSSRRKSATR